MFSVLPACVGLSMSIPAESGDGVMMGLICFVFDMFVLCFDMCCVLSFARVCWSVHTCRER